MNAPPLPPIILIGAPQPPPDFWVAHANYGVEIIAAMAVIIAATLSFFSAWTATRVARINAEQAASVAATNAELTVRVSHGAKIAEFREKWLGELRNDITEFLGAAARLNRMWQELNNRGRGESFPSEHPDLFPLENEARILLWRLSMRLNPRRNDFLPQDTALLENLEGLLINPQNFDQSWDRRASDAVWQARELLKREWEVTKQFPGTLNPEVLH